jgi:hypothetical protein
MCSLTSMCISCNSHLDKGGVLVDWHKGIRSREIGEMRHADRHKVRQRSQEVVQVTE